jgi:hypothetical protein
MPAYAIIAALSVQLAKGGMCTRSSRSAPSARARRRSSPFAATPPPRTTSRTRSRTAASTTFRASTSVTAAWNAAQVSHTSASDLVPPARSTRCATCVLIPEKLISAEAVDATGGPAGVGEAQKLCDLVEGFPRCVVPRRSKFDDRVSSQSIDSVDRCVPSRCQKAYEGELWHRANDSRSPQEDGEDVPHQMVDPHEGLAASPCDPLGRLDAYE